MAGKVKLVLPVHFYSVVTLAHFCMQFTTPFNILHIDIVHSVFNN